MALIKNYRIDYIIGVSHMYEHMSENILLYATDLEILITQHNGVMTWSSISMSSLEKA